jgi:hypothetical protein
MNARRKRSVAGFNRDCACDRAPVHPAGAFLSTPAPEPLMEDSR